MKKKLLFSVTAAIICVANIAWAAAPPKADCKEECTMHSQCPQECKVCYPNPFGPYCAYNSQE